MMFDIGGGAPDKTKIQDLLAGPKQSQRHMYQEVSFGMQDLEIELLGPYKLPEATCLPIVCCGPKANQPNGPAVADIIAGLPKKYDHYFWVYGPLPGGAVCGTWGDEGSPAKPAVYSSYSFHSLVGYAQELGHNFGMSHEPFMNCKGKTLEDDTTQCTHDEYGSPLSFMGDGPSHPSAYHKQQQGWLEQVQCRQGRRLESSHTPPQRARLRRRSAAADCGAQIAPFAGQGRSPRGRRHAHALLRRDARPLWIRQQNEAHGGYLPGAQLREGDRNPRGALRLPSRSEPSDSPLGRRSHRRRTIVPRSRRGAHDYGRRDRRQRGDAHHHDDCGRNSEHVHRRYTLHGAGPRQHQLRRTRDRGRRDLWVDSGPRPADSGVRRDAAQSSDAARAGDSANPARDAAFEATVMNPLPEGGSFDASATGEGEPSDPSHDGAPPAAGSGGGTSNTSASANAESGCSCSTYRTPRDERNGGRLWLAAAAAALTASRARRGRGPQAAPRRAPTAAEI